VLHTPTTLPFHVFQESLFYEAPPPYVFPIFFLFSPVLLFFRSPQPLSSLRFVFFLLPSPLPRIPFCLLSIRLALLLETEFSKTFFCSFLARHPAGFDSPQTLGLVIQYLRHLCFLASTTLFFPLFYAVFLPVLSPFPVVFSLTRCLLLPDPHVARLVPHGPLQVALLPFLATSVILFSQYNGPNLLPSLSLKMSTIGDIDLKPSFLFPLLYWYLFSFPFQFPLLTSALFPKTWDFLAATPRQKLDRMRPFPLV